MSGKQAEQWTAIAENLKEASNEHRKVLEAHYNAFNRGWIAGLSSARQQSLMFRHSALKSGEGIPEHLRAERSEGQLFRDYKAFLITKAKLKTDKITIEESRDNHPMENEMVAFHYGWLAGLENWQGA